MISGEGEATHVAAISADVDRLWAIVRVFGDVADWHPVLLRSSLVAGEEGRPGAEREIVTTDHQVGRERLVLLDEEARRLGYEMLVFPIPVVRQGNEIQLEPDGAPGITRITFSCRFVPAEGTDVAEVAEMNRSAFAQAAEGLARFAEAEVIPG